jgi:hypothetical protein
MSTLWEGETHLLLVTSWPSGESYRRFFFADIQALILRRTNRRMVINIVFGAIGLLVVAAFLAGYSQSVREFGLLVAAGIAAGVFLVFILINSVLGATCTLHVQTPIQCEQLTTIRRIPGARELLRRILPRIVTAQPAFEIAPVEQPGTI